jgi:hypothetical protein
VLDAYDFTYRELAKCDVKARNEVRVLEIDDSVISDLLSSNQEFKKRWFKSLFVYCYRIHFGL